ncbi:Hydrophobic protein OSR8 [Platanthera guangdongensis]|uniref:Hydrophobic protein OSR8 n=1 Tax=Platanthera guangdongensis TaxID=2320717 RepID=A0ABR2LFH2_9ASPA
MDGAVCAPALSDYSTLFLSIFDCFFPSDFDLRWFCICLLLTILGYIPGIVYAIDVIVSVDPERHRQSRTTTTR